MWRAEEGRGGYCESIGAEEDDWRGGRRAFGAARALATCASADDILEIVCGARGGDLTPSDVVTAAHELGKDARKASRALRGDARFLRVELSRLALQVLDLALERRLAVRFRAARAVPKRV